MKAAVQDPLPGAVSAPLDMLRVALEYHRAAINLQEDAETHTLLATLPQRLCAVHAVELYLHAFLLSSDVTSDSIRGHNHNLGALTTEAAAKGLVLTGRARTELGRIGDGREALVTEYQADHDIDVGLPNGMDATLNEVALKIVQRFEGVE